VVKCPECDAEMDLDEDEVEEGEILSCPECDVELEVTQIHPVHVIPLTDEDDDDDEEEADGETADAVEEPGDLIEDEAE
jgi:alpha-aminoadipate/glutamate carrier protein LysW